MTRAGADRGFDDFVEALSSQTLPPVHQWEPRTVRDMDLVIDASGTWHYRGTPFARQDLVRLLSGVMVREGDEFFLVSPGEKLRITVEDAPFVATEFELTGEGASRRIVFDTNVDYKVPLDEEHPLTMRRRESTAEDAPYLLVRNGLEARVARGVFYRLVSLGEERSVDGQPVFGISSYRRFFPLSEITW